MRFFEILLEYKRDVTKKQLGDRLVAASQRDRQQDIDTILAELEAMDPTANKQYVMWLANQYIKGLFRLEDKPRVKDVLEKFIKARSRLPEKDIGRYTFHSLEDEMDKIYNVELKPQQTADEPTTFEVPDNVDVLYNGPLGLLAIPLTKKASCELGSGTKWCTAGREDNRFTHYNKQGPLYIWRDKNGDKYQFHFGKYDFQFMDDKDQPIKKELLDQFRTQHPVLKQLFKEKEAEMAVSKRNMGTMDTLIRYARDVIKGRWPEIEARIVRNPEQASDYARDVIKGRWPEIEARIVRNPEQASDYARDVIKGRWPEAEKVIVNYPYWAYYYAKEVIKKRWPEIEARIARDPHVAYEYARDVMKKRWPEIEAAIARDSYWAYKYAKDVIKGRWPEIEAAIAREPELAYKYARDVIEGRFLEGEEAIAQDPDWDYYYKQMLRQKGIDLDLPISPTKKKAKKKAKKTAKKKVTRR